MLDELAPGFASMGQQCGLADAVPLFLPHQKHIQTCTERDTFMLNCTVGQNGIAEVFT